MSSAASHPAPPDDTTAEAEAVLLDRIREMSPQERLQRGCGLSRRCRLMAMDAMRRLDPSADGRDIRLRFIELAYGSALAADVRSWLQARGP